MMEGEVIFLYKHLQESQYYLFTAISLYTSFTHSFIPHMYKQQDIWPGPLVYDTKDKEHKLPSPPFIPGVFLEGHKVSFWIDRIAVRNYHLLQGSL